MPCGRAFVSYSHSPADAHLRERFDTVLEILRDLGIVESWNDTAIQAGEEWEAELEGRLDGAHLVLLLVSPDFLASVWCRREMERAKNRAVTGTVRVIPILLRETPFWEEYVGHLQVLPPGGKPVKSWADLDKAWKEVAHALRAAAESMGLYTAPAAPRAPGSPRPVQARRFVESAEIDESATGAG